MLYCMYWSMYVMCWWTGERGVSTTVKTNGDPPLTMNKVSTLRISSSLDPEWQSICQQTSSGPFTCTAAQFALSEAQTRKPSATYCVQRVLFITCNILPEQKHYLRLTVPAMSLRTRTSRYSLSPTWYINPLFWSTESMLRFLQRSRMPATSPCACDNAQTRG